MSMAKSISMVKDSYTIEDIFANPDILQVMYFLAEHNPNITMKVISEDTKLPLEKIEDILSKLQSLQLVYREKTQGYTLTDSGIASLYNFHKHFVSIKN